MGLSFSPLLIVRQATALWDVAGAPAVELPLLPSVFVVLVSGLGAQKNTVCDFNFLFLSL